MKEIKSMLVVDDDDTALFVAKKELAKMGLGERVLTAGNGLEAFLLLRGLCENPESPFPELILVDLNMPVMNGFKLIEAIGSLTPTAKPLIVVLTSSDNAMDRVKAHNLRVDGYLLKPIRRDSLSVLLDGLMP